jgi:hypothetical protein
MIRGILNKGPLSPRELLAKVILNASGVNPNSEFSIQHALESFLGFPIPEGEEGFVFLQGDAVRATPSSYDIILKDGPEWTNLEEDSSFYEYRSRT